MDYIEIADTALLSVLFVSFIFQLVYYWGYFFKPYKYQKRQEQDGREVNQPPVSVIITGHNEARYLEDFMPVILNQDYPEYQVIFVNDASTDDTEDVLKRLAYQYPHFYYTYIQEGSKNLSRKKLALTLGIKAAKYDVLLFTEAGAFPDSPDWITRMASQFSEKKKIVLGFSCLEKYPSKYAVYDHFFSNLKMMSLALSGHPYMGNGWNLIYSKQYFEEQKGFSRINFLDVGEDDLFINQIASSTNTAVELSPESIVKVDMPYKKQWKELKNSRMISCEFYKKYPVFFWNTEEVTRALFYLTFVLSAAHFIFYSNWIFLAIVAFFFLFRLFTQLYVINKTSALLKLKEHKFYFSILFFDIIQLFVNANFYFYKVFRKRNHYNWKYERR